MSWLWESGTTVLLTTHDMGDIERLSDRVLVIDHGHLIYDGDLEALRRTFGAETVLVADLEEPGPALEIPGARLDKVEGSRQWLRFRREEVSAAAVVADVAAKVALRDPASRSRRSRTLCAGSTRKERVTSLLREIGSGRVRTRFSWTRRRSRMLGDLALSPLRSAAIRCA